MLDYIGFFGPYILIFLILYSFLYSFSLINVIYYILGVLFIFLFNNLLKSYIKQPRPTYQKTLFNFEKKYYNSDYSQKYGMPSGYSQLVWFNVIYIGCILKNLYFFILSLGLALNTMRQRYVYRNNTMNQIIIGSIVGICIGYIFYFIIE